MASVEAGPVELARCWVEPGTDNFFEPDQLRCVFGDHVWQGAGSVNWNGTYRCGQIYGGFFTKDHDFSTSNEVTLANLVAANNTCPDGKTGSPYPLAVDFSFYGTGVVSAAHELTWHVQGNGPDAATRDKPLVAQLPVRFWPIVVENHLENTVFASIDLDPYDLPLGELRAVGHNQSASPGVSSVEACAEIRHFSFNRPQDSANTTEPPVQSIRLVVPEGVKALGGTLRLNGVPSALTITQPGRYILSDTGFTLVPGQPDPSPGPGTEPDPEPEPEDPCAGACDAEDVCVAGACVPRGGQTQTINFGNTCYAPTRACDPGEDHDCAPDHGCVAGLCRRLACQTQNINFGTTCYQADKPCEGDGHCASGHTCVSGLCRRTICQSQGINYGNTCYDANQPCARDIDCADNHACVFGLCRRLVCQNQDINFGATCYPADQPCDNNDAHCADGHVCGDENLCLRLTCN